MNADSPSSRLQQQQQQQETSTEGGQQQAGIEFATAEEVLRHDRASVLPPATIESRLQQSIAAEPPPPKPWWRRWLGR